MNFNVHKWVEKKYKYEIEIKKMRKERRKLEIISVDQDERTAGVEVTYTERVKRSSNECSTYIAYA